MATNVRADILDAADELFGSVGFDAASTRVIAEACSVNKALIHYHFQSKQGLFNAVLDRYYQRLDEVVRQTLVGEGSARERLGRLLDAYVDFLASNPGFSRMVQREATGGRHVERIVGHMVPIFERGVALMEAQYPATRSGELAASQLLVSFYGMVVSYFTYGPVLEGLLGTDPLSAPSLEHRKRHLRRMLDLIADALEAESTVQPAPRRGNKGKGRKK